MLVLRKLTLCFLEIRVMKANIEKDFEEIMNYAHYWNWFPDWYIVQRIYEKFPNSYSVLTPFAYSYLEELIRSTTTEYGIKIANKTGKEIKRKVGIGLINLSIKEIAIKRIIFLY